MTKGQKIVELLKAVDPNTIWGHSIHKVVHLENAEKVVDLVIELRSQSRDNPPVMEKILGAECFAEIMSI